MTMQDAHLVLHGIAVKKYATVEDIASVTALDPAVVTALVGEAVAKGRASEANGKYLLTYWPSTLKSSLLQT